MTIEDRPTIAERYSRAVRSHHLEVKASPGDVDVLIAAGWLHRDDIGGHLLRTRLEFDAARADARRAEKLAAKVHQAGSRAEHAATTALLLVLMEMRSLGGTKQALYHYANRQATFEGLMRDPEDIAQVAGRALELWLDPLCRACDGRGFTGGYGVPTVLCTRCSGTGAHRFRLHRHNGLDRFGRWMLVEMDRKTEAAGMVMVRFLRNRG